MAWDQLSINKPHLVYIILGGFTSIFMLVSLFVKEKLYIGEATVATICGLIFGPHAANLINPLSWGNTDQITLEFSRIVLVVQCFAVGVELPKSYMERHWKSVALLLVPVMTFGWLITSLFIWWMIVPLSWLESLCVAACVTATDPVLASSVVGKGKFAKRVPRHIRDLLSAESGCNDGMAFPFIYLALYLIRYHLNASHVTFHWICYTILYECIWGAVFGVTVGYIARHAIKLAERKGLIDRESFLVFYFVLALFCAGAGSLLGMDDLLIGFAAGVGFSNDGWFTERTHETHVSDVIDLLLNLSYFVYLGTIIPWDQYNNDLYGVEVWRLVVIALLVIFFRRIPAMMALKPIIPDIKTWREALFCGHFGPIGVGAIFVAILARAELETGETTPLAVPDPENAEYPLIYLIWPVVTFLVVTSIVVHGSSIAVFTLGKRINTLTLTMSFTKDNDNTQNWMNRLPRIASQSKSLGRSFSSDRSDWSLDEKDMEKAPSGLPMPKIALKRIKEGERPSSRNSSRTRSRSKRRRNRKYEDGEGPGGRIDPSAIHPARRSEPNLTTNESGSDTLVQQSERPSPGNPDQEPTSEEQVKRTQSGDSDSDRGERPSRHRKKASQGGGHSRRSSDDDNEDVDVEAYEEGHELIVEDTEGNILTQVETAGRSRKEKAKIVDSARKKLREDDTGEYARRESEPHEKDEGEELQRQVSAIAGHPDKTFKDHFKGWRGFGKKGEDGDKQAESSKRTKKQPERKSGPAHAYMYGNTVVIEDEDGEVIKEYTIPKDQADGYNYGDRMRSGVQRMGTFIGLGDRRKSTAVGPTALDGNEMEQEETAAEQIAASDKGSEKDISALAEQAGDSQARNKRKAHLRRGISTDSNISDDDGLRMTVSRAETYGLTGLQKGRAGDRPDTLQDYNRRMSTRDLFKHLQQLDKQRLDKQAKKDVLRSDQVDERTKRAIRDSEAEPVRAGVKRAGTMPITPSKTPPTTNHTEEEAPDYFSNQPTSPRGHQRARAKSDANTSAPTRTRVDDDGFDEDEVPATPDIPTHNVRGSVFRHGRGQTAADRRRARYESNAGTAAAAAAPEAPTIHEDEDENEADHNETSAERRRRLAALGQNQNDSDADAEALRQYHDETGAERRRRLAALSQREQESTYRPSRRPANDSDDEQETAAEERRRLAALGKVENESSSSSDEDEEEPRRPKRAVPEPGQEPAPRQEQAPQPRTRIQWGRVAREGREEDLEAQRPNNAGDTQGEGRGLVGRLRRGLTKKE